MSCWGGQGDGIAGIGSRLGHTIREAGMELGFQRAAAAEEDGSVDMRAGTARHTGHHKEWKAKRQTQRHTQVGDLKERKEDRDSGSFPSTVTPILVSLVELIVMEKLHQ